MHGTIGATRVTGEPGRPLKDVRPCPRCGVERLARKSSGACADCRAVLSPAEVRAWAA
jgi:hypothetical protein